jgi:hypothetical protein
MYGADGISNQLVSTSETIITATSGGCAGCRLIFYQLLYLNRISKLANNNGLPW